MFGVGRHPLDVLRIPWDMTFDGGSYMENGSGAIGLALLLTLPLILLVPRTRASAFLLALAAIGFVGWAYTAQYIRYGLPLFAIVAVLCGAGVARATTFRSRGGRLVARALPLFLIGALAVTPVLWLPVWGSQLPAGLFSGSQSREEWLTTWVRGHAMLVKAGELLPEDTPVGWASSVQAAQAYTEALMLSGRCPLPPQYLPRHISAGSPRRPHLTRHRLRHPGPCQDDPLGLAGDPILDILPLRPHQIFGAKDGAYLFEILDTPGDPLGPGCRQPPLGPGVRGAGRGRAMVVELIPGGCRCWTHARWRGYRLPGRGSDRGRTLPARRHGLLRNTRSAAQPVTSVAR